MAGLGTRAKTEAAEPLVILGVDPGSRHTGWGVIERRGSRLLTLGHGRISPPGGAQLAERLVVLSDGLAALVERHRPQVAVLEALFHGVNPRSLIVLAQARGAILTTLCRCGLELHEYSPAEIKSAVTGNGRADKEQVAKMVGLLLGLRARGDGTSPSSDATDALAVAICYGQRARLDELASTRRASGGRRGPQGGGTPVARDR
jgi:crossover junction endodeoxyribonuclease RuvC